MVNRRAYPDGAALVQLDGPGMSRSRRPLPSSSRGTGSHGDRRSGERWDGRIEMEMAEAVCLVLVESVLADMGGRMVGVCSQSAGIDKEEG